MSEELELHNGEFQADDVFKAGRTLTMTLHDYENQFRFTVADGDTRLTCTLNPKSARLLADKLASHFTGEPQKSVHQRAADLTGRMIEIIQLIEGEEKGNQLAMASFVAGYFGYRIAP